MNYGLQQEGRGALFVDVQDFCAAIRRRNCVHVFFNFHGTRLIRSVLYRRLARNVLGLLQEGNCQYNGNDVVLHRTRVVCETYTLKAYGVQRVLVVRHANGFAHSIEARIRRGRAIANDSFAVCTIGDGKFGGLVHCTYNVKYLCTNDDTYDVDTLTRRRYFVNALRTLPTLITIRNVVTSTSNDGLTCTGLHRTLFRLPSVFGDYFQASVASIRRDVRVGLNRTFGLHRTSGYRGVLGITVSTTIKWRSRGVRHLTYLLHFIRCPTRLFILVRVTVLGHLIGTYRTLMSGATNASVRIACLEVTGLTYERACDLTTNFRNYVEVVYGVAIRIKDFYRYHDINFVYKDGTPAVGGR